MLTAGALAAMPDHAGLQATESSIGSEKGFVTDERPPAVIQDLPEQPRPNYKYFPVQPDYIHSPLLKDGVDCLHPDPGTEGAHYSEWQAKPMTLVRKELMMRDLSYPGLGP